VRRKIADGSVIQVLRDDPLPTFLCNCTDETGQVAISTHDDQVIQNLAARRNHLTDHGFFQKRRSINTIGIPIIKRHANPLGLVQLEFSNCVVKVRLGHDFEQLITFSSAGSVHLSNVESCGWFGAAESMLPVFLYLRWISSMVAVRDLCGRDPNGFSGTSDDEIEPITLQTPTCNNV
jgi:hypothetical protein